MQISSSTSLPSRRDPAHLPPARGPRRLPVDAPPLHLWEPAGFTELIGGVGPLRGREDLARYVAHAILWRQVFKSPTPGGFVPLKAATLRQAFPSNPIYTTVMDALRESGAIVRTSSYTPGVRSYGFRLGPGLEGGGHARVPITDPVLARKVARKRARAARGPRDEVERYLERQLRDVEIDRDAALGSVRRSRHRYLHEAAIEFIHAGDFRLTSCNFGRVHTNLTNLKSSLRRFLTVRGERLVNLDIRNSQPLVFASILKDRFGCGEGGQDVPMREDVALYIRLVQEGRFYDHLMDAAGIAPERRKRFKRGFFANVFFCENRPLKRSARLFGEQFPNVFEVIQDLKAADHATLAHLLQRRESGIMIEGVASRCMRELPGAFVATIHDSILTTPGNAEAIRRIMMEEFARVGLKPTIRIEE